MTIETALERNAFEANDRRVCADRLMAAGTRYIDMAAGKPEPRIVVRESGDRFPSFCRMACPALRSKLPAVRIGVTCHTRRAEPEIRSPTQQRLICTHVRCLYELRLVTLGAFQVRMFPVKGEPRRAFVVVPRLVEPCDGEGTPMVLFVTLDAFMP
jgi:hypothetical protein